MSTFHVFDAVTSCDKDWHYLGEIQANDKDEALTKARQQWKAWTELVVIEQEASIVAQR